MSVLRNLESKLAGLVEGTFSRAFKSEVRPVEIARKLAREMDQHRVTSLNQTYAPNEYRVWLSPQDREQFAAYEHELLAELSGYLLEHARRERIALITTPKIEFMTDEGLRLGEFGIQARLVSPGAHPGAVASQQDHGHTQVYSTSDRIAEQRAMPPDDPRMRRAVVAVNGRRRVVEPDGAVIGRSRECGVMVDDPNVSRKHAELRPQGNAWVLVDLGSTNGVKLNGQRVRNATPLKPGDVIEMGTSRLQFDLE